MAIVLTDSVALTGDNRIDGLVEGGRWFTSLGGPTVLTYALDYTGFQTGTWTAQRIALADQAFQMWSNVANIQFQRIEVGGDLFSSGADIAVGLSGRFLANNLQASSLGVFPDSRLDSAVRTLFNRTAGNWPKPEGDVFLDDGQQIFSQYWFVGGAGHG